MIELHDVGDGKYRVSVECGGVKVISPARELVQMYDLYMSLMELDNERLALIRLARLCIYQVCND